MSPAEFWRATMVEVYWFMCAKLPEQRVGNLSENEHYELLQRFQREVLNNDD